MRLSPRPSVSPSSPSPQLLDWTHKAGTDPESYGRRCVRVLLPPPLRLGTCSCCTPPPHRRPLNCLVSRTSLLCRLQSALPETTFTGGIACRANCAHVLVCPPAVNTPNNRPSLTMCFVVPQ
ncbi:hypothetical protein COCCADRAFT_37991 [Bipolaris zeicola 26-R-13]|uniref:Uncharacterized protein n=1 Tax=Cochliobolus carbonum (strain 26-R-13) TaxID=930089 RepID=W6Y231_COCC2|nr:uncharacterized protein COCCADRAFT_37991 [Bipolaris zeicola 26-R-13]EUC31968.1 hypothetical protein COCCADRAFT_37991 [Bipolaris zeicola 26-R-13]